ncbi:MAG: trypsin-like peptidase domain-containing protein [Chloroflexi bacterium]|nr:trypsin-like peptidase domain-containing protein [Chloroflexota bacterium]
MNLIQTRWKSGILVFAAFAMFIAIAAVACSDDAASPTAPGESVENTQVAVVETIAGGGTNPSPQTGMVSEGSESEGSGGQIIQVIDADPEPTDQPQVAEISEDDILAAYESTLARIYKETLPSVVGVRITVANGGNGEGSGFVWSEDGHIVTNNHVVASAASITVVFADGTEASAEVVGTDPNSDLAVIKVDLPDKALRPLALGDSDALFVGQIAAAIGNPFSQDFTLTTGIVSALGRTVPTQSNIFAIPGLIQTDAAINPGNSGGPLLNRHGEVIGVNTMIFSQSGSSSGIGFAVPVNTVKRVASQLIDTGTIAYSYIGIQATSLTQSLAQAIGLAPNTRGALVTRVLPDGPAAGSDLRGSGQTAIIDGQTFDVGGDVIVSVDGTPVTSMDALLVYLQGKTRPGETITLGVLRNGEPMAIEITLGSRPSG